MDKAMRAIRLAILVMAAAAAGGEPAAVTVHLDRPATDVAAWLAAGVLPAPGTPGAASLLPQLVRNPSFEQMPKPTSLRLPEAWGKAEGWDYVTAGSKRMVVRRRRGRGKDVLLLASKKRWGTYRYQLIARKIDGPGGFCVLVEVTSAKTHLRWTLGAKGNRLHVLEKVRGGQAEQLGPGVVGRIEAGRAYKLEVWRRKGEMRFALNGRLIHRVKAEMPDGGIGLADADAAAEYLDVAVYGSKDTPRFLLDHPAEARRPTVAAGWEPLLDEGNDATFAWDWLYPHNSSLSQSIRVRLNPGGDLGIRQREIPIDAGKTYRGHVSLRAKTPATVTVSLRSRAGRILASQVFADVAEAWKSYALTLKPTAGDKAADLCITVSGVASVWVDQVTLAADGAAAPSGLSVEAVAALRKARPLLLRWPAGPGLPHYVWRDGVGPPHGRHAAATTDGTRGSFIAAPNAFGTNEFVALCRAVAAEPVFTVHPAWGLRPPLYWLEYVNGEPETRLGRLRAEHGHERPHGVRLWAIDGLPLDELDIEHYAEQAGKLAKAMREEDPSIRVVPLLWGSHMMQGRLEAEASGAPRLRVAAARGRGRAVVRLVHLGDKARDVTVTLKGKEQCAPKSRHLSLDAASERLSVADGELAAAGGVVRLAVRPSTVHVIVLSLKGDPR